MNEIELQKLLVKQAFTKTSALPSFGGMAEENSIKIRNYIWKVCNTPDGQATKASAQDESTVSQSQNKKLALVALYRLWSAFSKNMRYIIDHKSNAVTLNRIGTFCRSQADPQKVAFIPGPELVSSLQVNLGQEQPGSEKAQSPEWQKIGPAASLPSQEIARLLIQAVFAMAVQKAKNGNEVTLALKIGRLELCQGQVDFESERLSQVGNQQPRQYPISHSQLGVRKDDEEASRTVSISPLRQAIPQSAVISPRVKSIEHENPSSPASPKVSMTPSGAPYGSHPFQTSNQLFASAYAKSLVSKVQPKADKKPTSIHNIFAQRRGKSVIGMQSNKLPSLESGTVNQAQSQFRKNTFTKRQSSIQQPTSDNLLEMELQRQIPTKTQQQDEETVSRYSGIMYASPRDPQQQTFQTRYKTPLQKLYSTNNDFQHGLTIQANKKQNQSAVRVAKFNPHAAQLKTKLGSTFRHYATRKTAQESGLASPGQAYGGTMNPQVSSILTNAPFSRTKQAFVANQDLNFTKDRLGDRTAFQEVPSEVAVASFKSREQMQRSEGKESARINSMIFSGTGNFYMQKKLNDQKTQGQRERADQTNQLARMRFNIGIEKAKKTELEKELEERELAAAKQRRQDAEALVRRTNLTNAQNTNLKMHAQIQEQAKFSRIETLKDRDNIQTSLKSKKVEDAQETFKQSQRKQALQEANQQNLNEKHAQTQNYFATRTNKLRDEQNWLQQISDVQANESNFLQQQRQLQIHDLRNTYAEQQYEKSEREKFFVKF